MDENTKYLIKTLNEALDEIDELYEFPSRWTEEGKRVALYCLIH